MSKSRARPQLELSTHYLPTTDGPGQDEKEIKNLENRAHQASSGKSEEANTRKQKPRPDWGGLLSWTSGRDIGHISAWELDPCALLMGSDIPDSSAWSWLVSGLQSSG